MINFKEINLDNFWDIIDLSVSDEQDDYVATNAVSIAQSKVQPECTPLAIYDGDKPVGFTMFCMDRNDEEYWIYRLMIDKEHQGHGYGRQALNLLLSIIKKDLEHHMVYLSVNDKNTSAIRMYQSFGFEFDGRLHGTERVMVLRY